jgi:LL-diaminopimelate aminotransferase
MGVKEIRKLPSTPENDFFPDLSIAKGVDLIYFCSPNNPTGAVATRKQLEGLVAFAKKEKALILFDNAYSSYIQDPSLPSSIFTIPGAHEVALEVNSFSKMAGFTGVRVGWTAMSKHLSYPGGGSIFADWKRVVSTTFNGASNVAQAGAIASLSEEGWSELESLVANYMSGAKKMTGALRQMGYKVYGGDNAPYCWVQVPGKSSWDTFQSLLENAHIVTVPGSGFGPSGEGFIRLSAFAPLGEIEKAMDAFPRL